MFLQLFWRIIWFDYFCFKIIQFLYFQIILVYENKSSVGSFNSLKLIVRPFVVGPSVCQIHICSWKALPMMFKAAALRRRNPLK